MAGRRSLPLLVALLLLADVASLSDADVLLKFKSSISDAGGSLRSWTSGSNPCNKKINNWAGVMCDRHGGVAGLRLESMSLAGAIDVGVLERLPRLRTVNFMDNDFDGPMPELGKLQSLRGLYLSENKFSGEIPDEAFAGMSWLKKLYLSRNEFSGPIPKSIAELPKLLELGLDSNRFEGAIPDLRSKGLKMVNMSNNNLEGSIPKSLQKMNPNLFSGNEGLCGKSLGAPCPSPLPPTPSSTPPKPSSTSTLSTLSPPSSATSTSSASSSSSSSSSTTTRTASPTSSPSRQSITLIVLAVLVFLAVVAMVLVAWDRRRAGQNDQVASPQSAADEKSAARLEEGVGGSDASSTTGSSRKAAKDPDYGRLIFVRENRERFELHDLLKSQAEVLGAGNFGCSYKASLPNGSSMVVKRFRHMNKMGKEDFVEHMRRMGRLSHPNLLPLVSYYYRKDEKLLVTDYVPKRSLANALHGSNDSGISSMDWLTRLKIVKGIARGLNYLYEELQMLTVPHGHLKSSNVLLSGTFEPLLTDYALVPLMNQAHAAQFMAAYKSPELLIVGTPLFALYSKK